MRYDIEQTCISPYLERRSRTALPNRTIHVEARSPEEAISNLMRTDHAQLVSDILSFDRERVATIRKDDLLFLIRLQTPNEVPVTNERS